MRTPTEKQYRVLLVLGSGAMMLGGISGEHRPQWRGLLRHGWVVLEPDPEGYPEDVLRITADGLRALALAVEKYGLPFPDMIPSGLPIPYMAPSESLLVRQLRAARDEARAERDEAVRKRRQDEKVARRVLDRVLYRKPH